MITSNNTDRRRQDKATKRLMGYIADHHNNPLKTMTDEQKEIFEKFGDCWSEYMSLAEATIFEYTFKLGMRIAIEAINE